MDSRSVALRYINAFREMRWPLGRSALLFTISFGVALMITWLLQTPSFTDTLTYALFISVFAILLWVTEAIPAFAVGLLIMGFSVFFLGSPLLNSDPANPDIFVNTWSSSVIWLMLGGYFLATSLSKTQLDKTIFYFSRTLFGTRPPYVLLGLMITTAVLSMIMSNTATTAMMIASVTPFLRQLKSTDPLRKSLLLGIPAAGSLGGMGTVIGSPPNLIALGALEKEGITINFVEWMYYGVPLAVVSVLLFWWMLLKKYKPSDIKVTIEIDEPGYVNKQHLIVTISTLALTMGLWLTNPIHHIPSAVVAMIPIVTLTISGIIDTGELRSMPWDTLILVAGGLTLGKVIDHSGLAGHYLDQLSFEAPEIVMLIVFGFLTVLMSNVMSNTATTALIIPIALAFMPGSMQSMALVIGLCASNALMLPVSTPPNAIAFSTGMLKQSDFRMGGLAAGILAPVLITFWILFML